MSENQNELSETQRRADRINAIKKSIHTSAPEEQAETALSPTPQQPSGTGEWESELSDRIAQRIRKVKENKHSAAAEIISELDAAMEAEDQLSAKADDAAEALSEAQDADPAEDIINEEADGAAVQEPEAESVESQIDRAVAALAAAAEEEVPAEEEAPAEEAPAEEAPAEKPKDSLRKKKKKKKKNKKKTVGSRLLGLLPQKGDSVGERLRKLVFLGSVVAIIVCGYMVGDYYFDLWRASKINDSVMDMYWTYPANGDTPQDTYGADGRVRYYTMLDGARKLLDMNEDVVGVISIPDTPVNNPLMQAEDNSKYLDIKIDGTESRSGEIFLDFRNHFDEVGADGTLAFPNSDNLVIYGHNMKNDEMFGSLKYYQRNENYYGEHPLIYLNSNYECYTYKIFAFFIVDAEDETDTKFDCWNKINFDDEQAFYDFVNEAKRRTLRLNDVDVKYGDPLITLSTCNTLLGDRGRLIILARRVRDGEDPLEGTQDSVANPNIKWPTLYYDSKPNEKYDPDAEFVPYGPAETEE